VNWATGFKTAINNRGEIISCNKPLFYSRKMITGGFHFTFLPSIQQESTFWRSSLNLEIEHTELIKHKLAGDYFLWRSFAKSHKLYVVNAMLGAFRIHPGQLSLDRTRYRAEIRELQRRPASSYIVALLMKLLWRSQGRIAKLIASNRTFSFDLDSNKWELIRDKIVKRYNWKNISKKRN
jgi:hypothetical protein